MIWSQSRSSDVEVVNNGYGKDRPPDIEQYITAAVGHRARYRNINRFGKMGFQGGVPFDDKYGVKGSVCQDWAVDSAPTDVENEHAPISRVAWI